MLKTLIKLSAVQNSALSNYLFPAHEKIKHKSFLNWPSQQRGEESSSYNVWRVPINKAENILRGKKLHILTQPIGGFSSIIKHIFLIGESKLFLTV